MNRKFLVFRILFSAPFQPKHIRRKSQIVRLAIIGIVLVLTATPVVAGHPKTDIVTIDDGSILYGEILSVKYAALSLKTDAVGTLNIEWRRITGLTSKYEYQVEVTGGTRHYGRLEPHDKPMHLKVVGSAGTFEFKLSDVVRLAPIEDTFWDRLNGSLNFGLTYTQANGAFQYNLGYDANYRSRKNYATLTASSIFNTQNDAESTQQSYIQLLLAQVNKSNWGPFELGAVQSNPDQGYDLRTLLGGGASRFFVESTTHMFALNLGAVYNREEVTNSVEVDNTSELLTGISYRRYKRDAYSPGVETSLNIFSDFSADGRHRAVFKFNVAWKIIHDYVFNFQVNNSYDSSPPGDDSSNNNVIVVTSIGYTF